MGVMRSKLHGESAVGGGRGSHISWSRGFLSSSLDDPVSSPTLPPRHPLVNRGGERKVIKAKSPPGICTVNNRGGQFSTFPLRTGKKFTQ